VRSRGAELGFSAAVIVFTVVYFVNAWVGDDAYITFRTIDNVVTSHGLRWNVIERVQSYTHPLWLLICAIPYALTREVFYTVILVSYFTCLAALIIFRRALPASDRWKSALLVMLLVASKTFMDWSSSGLENTLSALWGLCFVMLLAQGAGTSRRHTRRLFLVAALAYVTRQDTLLLYAPVLVWLLWTRRRAVRLSDVVIAVSPALLWTAFAVVYYGFPFPNTAYAKALVSGVSLEAKVRQGLAYLQIASLWDPFAIVTLLLFMYIAVRARSDEWFMLAWGVLAYVVYVIVIAASSSVMGLRFFSVPFVIAAGASVCTFEASEGVVAGILALVFISVAPLSPLRTLGCRWAQFEPLTGSASSTILDMRAQACFGRSALADYQRNLSLPDHDWLKMGRAFRKSPERVRFGGPQGAIGAMGFFGYAAGPDKVIVDPFGLTDPLMARVSVVTDKWWVPGEIPRQAPDGYLRTIETGTNQIVDPALHEYYDSLHLIVAGPVFSPLRWREILAMNLGRRDWLLREYAKRGR
jgi:arabinofuranosyltransferase